MTRKSVESYLKLPYTIIGSAHKAADLLHFRAEVGLGEGLSQTVEWMRKQ